MEARIAEMSIYPREKLMRDPDDVFKSPHDVIEAPDLSDEQKIAVLRQWKNEVIQEMIADEENMPGDFDHSAVLQEISNALSSLDDA